MYPEDFDFPNGCPMCRFFPPPPPPPGGMGGPQGGGPPSGPPPAYTPHKAQAHSMHAQGPGHGPGVMAVEAGGIRFCRFKYTYIWLENGRSFWTFIVFVGRNSISGWRWNGRFWVYFGIDLRRIDSFVCF